MDTSTKYFNYKNENKRNYYINLVNDNNLSVKELRTQIKNNAYERLDDKIKKGYHNPTIGIIICKKSDKEAIKYFNNQNIKVTTYKNKWFLIKTSKFYL